MVPALYAIIVHPKVTMAPKMDEALWTDSTLWSILGSVMICIEHELLTKIFKIKPSTFQDTEFYNLFEFIIYFYEMLQNMDIMKQYGVNFVPILLEKKCLTIVEGFHRMLVIDFSSIDL